MKVARALRSVAPYWLLMNMMSIAWGKMLEFIPGGMESAVSYGTDWISNMMHWDPNLEAHLLSGFGSYPGLVVKFPLFSMLASYLQQSGRLMNVFLSNNAAIYWTAKIGLLFGLVAVWLLTEYLEGESAADRVTLLVLFSPFGGGYTWMMAYPESWDLLFWALTLLYFYRKQYLLAGLIMGFAAVNRPQSIILVPILGFSFLWLYRPTIRKEGLRGFFDSVILRQLIALVAPALLGYMFWMALASQPAVGNSPFAPFAYQVTFGRKVWAPPWLNIVNLFVGQDPSTLNTPSWQNFAYQVGSLLCGSALVVYFTWKRQFKWEIALYTLAVFLVPLSSDYASLARYALGTGYSIAFVKLPEKWDKPLIILGVFWAVLNMAAFSVGVNTHIRP